MDDENFEYVVAGLLLEYQGFTEDNAADVLSDTESLPDYIAELSGGLDDSFAQDTQAQIESILELYSEESLPMETMDALDQAYEENDGQPLSPITVARIMITTISDY